jgi:putative endonuclease
LTHKKSSIFIYFPEPFDTSIKFKFKRRTTKIEHFVYIVRCSDNSYYIGYTTNLNQRLKEHNEGSGGHNTKIKRPVKLMYHEEYDNKYAALKRETQLKRWSRAKKEALIKGDFDSLKKLSKRRKK